MAPQPVAQTWSVKFNRRVRLGVWYVIIFLWIQFWIRLAAVSYRCKKVRTLASPVVRWVNKTRDAQNCIRNGPQYVICVVTTRLNGKVLKFWNWICVSWHGKKPVIIIVLAVAPMTGHVTTRWQYRAMVTTHESPFIVSSFKALTLYCVLWNLLKMKKSDGFHIMVLSSLIWISILSRISDWSVHSGTYFSIRLGPLRWVPTAHGPLARYVNLRVAHAPGMPGTLSPPPRDARAMMQPGIAN